MGRNSSIVWLVGLGLALASCGGSSKDQKPDKTTCTPGERTCDGLNVKLCAEDGTTQTVDATCLPSQTCSEGKCSPAPGDQSCSPDTTICKDGHVYTCDSTGTSSTLAQTCGASQYCLEDDGEASCSNVACKPNGPLCDGDTATTCKADGSGPLPGGKSCADAGQACSEGLCHDFTCKAGEKLCQGGDVYVCGTNGTSSSLLADCNAGQVCDQAMLACRTKVCEPGKVSCSGSLVVACNDSGSEALPPSQDCAATSEACSNGMCLEKVCTPNTKFCKDGNVHSCDTQGVKSVLSQTCTPGYYHCEQYFVDTAYCASNQCSVGQVVCDNNVLKTCTAEGNLPATGTDCGADKYCDPFMLACVTKVCEPNTTYCKNGDVYYCNDVINEYPQQQCLSGTVCKKSGDVTTCVPLLCEPGETGCVGNKVGVCAEDGQTLTSTTQDCAALTNVCTVAGTCAVTAIDTLGIAEDAATYGGSTVIGDALEVHSARKVTSLEANLVLASARELRWVIYEQSGTSWIARIDKVVPNQMGTGFISSGAMSYTLKAGKRYLFAVAVTGGNFIPYYDTAPFEVGASFGSVIGSVNSGYSSNLPADFFYSETLYQMRITTVLP